MTATRPTDRFQDIPLGSRSFGGSDRVGGARQPLACEPLRLVHTYKGILTVVRGGSPALDVPTPGAVAGATFGNGSRESGRHYGAPGKCRYRMGLRRQSNIRARARCGRGTTRARAGGCARLPDPLRPAALPNRHSVLQSVPQWPATIGQLSLLPHGSGCGALRTAQSRATAPVNACSGGVP